MSKSKVMQPKTVFEDTVKMVVIIPTTEEMDEIIYDSIDAVENYLLDAEIVSYHKLDEVVLAYSEYGRLTLLNKERIKDLFERFCLFSEIEENLESTDYDDMYNEKFFTYVSSHLGLGNDARYFTSLMDECYGHYLEKYCDVPTKTPLQEISSYIDMHYMKKVVKSKGFIDVATYNNDMNSITSVLRVVKVSKKRGAASGLMIHVFDNDSIYNEVGDWYVSLGVNNVFHWIEYTEEVKNFMEAKEKQNE